MNFFITRGLIDGYGISVYFEYIYSTNSTLFHAREWCITKRDVLPYVYLTEHDCKDKELLTLLENPYLSLVLVGDCVTRSLVLYVMCCYCCLFFGQFSFGFFLIGFLMHRWYLLSISFERSLSVITQISG